MPFYIKKRYKQDNPLQMGVTSYWGYYLIAILNQILINQRMHYALQGIMLDT